MANDKKPMVPLPPPPPRKDVKPITINQNSSNSYKPNMHRVVVGNTNPQGTTKKK